MRTGYFTHVNQHEPEEAPIGDLTAAVWIDSYAGLRSSGLASTSVVITMNVRIYSNVQKDLPDRIDPQVMEATDALMASYSGDFTLDGLIRDIDLLGAESGGLRASAGYMGVAGTPQYRVMTIAVPMIVNDYWEQVA